MTREEQLKFCKVCKHRQMDVNQGLLCGLTNAKADFDGTCDTYDEDAVEKQKKKQSKRYVKRIVKGIAALPNYIYVV